MKILEFFAAFFSTVSLMARGYHSLTIDNQLVIIANDCYTRIAIGSILPSKEIAASVIAATVTECEDECSRKRSTCEIFSFGISSKGNATCLLGTRIPNADELVTNSDYDIYIRQQSSPHCMPDRLYKLGSGDRNPTNFNSNQGGDLEDTKNGKNETSRGPKPGNRPIGQDSIPRPGGLGIVAIPNAERIPVNGNQHSHQNHPGYHVAGVIPDFSPGYPPGIIGPIFDEDNPNGPINYAEKNPYGNFQSGYGGDSGGHRVQGGQNFNDGYQAGDFYPGESHEIGDGNRDDYYLHGVIDPGNRYGIKVYEAPDTVCSLYLQFYPPRVGNVHYTRNAIKCS